MRQRITLFFYLRRLSLVFMTALLIFVASACGEGLNDRINEIVDEITRQIREQLEEQFLPNKNRDFYELFDRVLDYHYDRPEESMLWSAAIEGLLTLIPDETLVDDITESLNLEIGDEDTFLLVFAAINEFDDSELTEDDYWMSAMFAVLAHLEDPYSRFVRFEDFAALQQGSQESFVGIGVGVENAGNNIRIVHVFPNSPAEGAGLMPGDVITHVDGEDVQAASYEMTLSLVLGPVDTEIELGIRRPGLETIVFMTMIRSIIPTPTAFGEIIEEDGHKVGYLRINTFGNQTAAITEDILEGFIEAGYEALIVDVRNNSGGALGTLNALLALFMQGSEEDPFFTIDWVDNETPQGFYSTATPLVDVPMVLLTNGFSASASEVFASALHERADVEVMGETTFGKGSVQTAFQLGGPLGDYLWLTVGNWFTPDGNNVGGLGYEPSLPISQNPYLNTPSIFVGDEPYGRDDEHELIGVAQRILQALGYGDTLQINGILDEDTQAALEAFQTDQALTVSGELNGTTAVALTTAITIYRNNPINDTQRLSALAYLLEQLNGEAELALHTEGHPHLLAQSPYA